MEGDSAADGGSNVVEVNLPTDIILKMNLNVIKMVWVQKKGLPPGRSFFCFSLTPAPTLGHCCIGGGRGWAGGMYNLLQRP